MTNNIGVSSLDNVSENSSIEDKYPNFNNKFNSDILSVSEDEDDVYEFPFNYYSSEEDDENISSLFPIPTLTTGKYKMGWQTNDEVEVNVDVNSVVTSDDITITNKE